MFHSSVRLALLGSVTCSRPPLSRQMSHESTVPKRISPRRACWRSPSRESSRCLIFVPEKYGSKSRPVFARKIGSQPSAFSRSQIRGA